jgi:hypothetical protein
VSHSFFVGVVIEMRLEETRRQLAGRVEKLGDTVCAKLDLIAGCGADDFDAIASRDDQPFTHDLAVDELAQATGAGFVVERESLADLYRSGLVIDSDEKNGHLFSHKKAQKAQKQSLPENVVSTQERCADERE